jgi:hypothetical protein
MILICTCCFVRLFQWSGSAAEKKGKPIITDDFVKGAIRRRGQLFNTN